MNIIWIDWSCCHVFFNLWVRSQTCRQASGLATVLTKWTSSNKKCVDDEDVKQQGFDAKIKSDRRECIRQGGLRVGRNANSPKRKTCNEDGHFLDLRICCTSIGKTEDIWKMKTSAACMKKSHVDLEPSQLIRIQIFLQVITRTHDWPLYYLLWKRWLRICTWKLWLLNWIDKWTSELHCKLQR